MNTADLVDRVSTRHGLSKTQAREVLDTIFAAISEAAAAGDEVALHGFGRFKVTDRPERQGRNPATGEMMMIAASRKLSFVPAKAVRDSLNVSNGTDTSSAGADEA